MDAQKTYNVLLLGETGVGKSTFINTILNYIAYKKLSDINELKHSIGVRFTIMNDDFTEKTIVVANDANEEHEMGKSATKRPQKHSIDLPDGSILNIIDTPGLGDTQGIEKDYKNVEKVLEFISEMETLNGICVMMKPNNSRLSVIFEYCIKTILGHLDENIRKNVIFIFSNARSSFYTPGDTQMPLEIILKSVDKTGTNPVPFGKFNSFCIESDWFRYIAAKKSGVNINDNQIKNFQDSFNKSSEEVHRMINYIKSLPPRQIKGLLSINEAKRLIRRLTSTIISSLISQRKKWRQVKLVEQKSKGILSNQKVLEENLYVNVKKPATQTTYTKTHQQTSTTKFGGSISLFGVGPILDKNTHSEFNERQVETTILLDQKVEDPHVKAQLNANESSLKQSEEERELIEEEVKELNNEFNTLLTASAQFNVFLKENVPFNSIDELEVYLEAKKTESVNIDENDVKMYDRILNKYITKKQSIYNVTIAEVDKTVKDLLNLKYSGPELKSKLQIDVEEMTGN